MSVICKYCEQSSRDHEFCDHCNREFTEAGEPRADAPSEFQLASGLRLSCSDWANCWPIDPATVLHVKTETQCFRVYGFSDTLWPVWREQVESRLATRNPALPPIEIIPVAAGTILVVESNPPDSDATELLHPCNPVTDWAERISGLPQLCAPFTEVMESLHQADLVWLNFAPDAMTTHREASHINNLDLDVFRCRESPSQLSVSARYSPPEVGGFQGSKIGPATDVYHLAILIYYWLANLPDGFPGEGIEAFQHRIPPLRIYQPTLPPGISPVIERALSYEPVDRYATVREFVAKLTEAVQDGATRCNSAPSRTVTIPTIGWPEWIRRLFSWNSNESDTVSSHVEIGGVTIAGRTKTALRLINQDAIDFGTIASPGHTSALVWFGVVADGVTNARAGSGDLASSIACRVVTDCLTAKDHYWSTDEGFASHLTQAARSASQQIVDKAKQQENLPRDLQDFDFMSSTLVAAVIHDRRLHVANLGDSRAYLVTKSFIEQLTIDGDVACTQLAGGAAPERVAELGTHAKALIYCLGAARIDENAGFVSDDDRSMPQYGHWPLQSGDIVVLCSDGLIDEGVFLNPSDAKQIIDAHRHESAQVIAERLVEAADARQREPSDTEPQGFGDNIACIVLKFDCANNQSSKETT